MFALLLCLVFSICKDVFTGRYAGFTAKKSLRPLKIRGESIASVVPPELRPVKAASRFRLTRGHALVRRQRGSGPARSNLPRGALSAVCVLSVYAVVLTFCPSLPVRYLLLAQM